MSISLDVANRINSLFSQQSYDAVINYAKQLINEGNEEAILYYYIFQANHHLEKDGDALFYIRRASELKQDNNDFKGWLLAELSINKKNESSQLFKELENSRDFSSLIGKGYYYIFKTQYNEALKSATDAQSIKADEEAMLLKLYALSNLTIDERQCETIASETEKYEDIRIKKQLLWVLFKNNADSLLRKYSKRLSLKYNDSSLTGLANDLVRRTIRQNSGGSNQPSSNVLPNRNLTFEEAIEGLNSLIGLESVKQQVSTISKSIQFEKERERRLGKTDSSAKSYHFVFSGNPGTGKTTVARYFGDIFKAVGILKSGHLVETDRSGLVGQYIGETAQKTKKKIEEAMGGVLFIDEAYALYKSDSNNDFGTEAIDTLVKALEDHRDEFIVIMAGYTDEMNELMKSNPGLESRINKFIEFPDYTDEELFQIAVKDAAENKYHLSSDGELAFKRLIAQEKVTNKFGNARTVRNIINEAIERKSLNAGDLSQLSDEELTTLTAEDFGVDLQQNPEDRIQSLIDELNSLVGLKEVKESISDLINTIRYNEQEELLSGRKSKRSNMHLAFLGNPGTGKTTVARIYAKILKEIGVLAKGTVKEASRSDLVSGYLGQTALKTKEKCQDAYGGVLFIDEAYSLCQGDNDSFGLEAISTLIKEMEDNRDKLIVIFAGYSKEMKDFFASNSGIESRISETITFPDYNSDELTIIFEGMVQKDGFIIKDEALELVRQLFTKIVENKNQSFGNGREARNIYEKIIKVLKKRVVKDNIKDIELRRRIEVSDVESVMEDY